MKNIKQFSKRFGFYIAVVLIVVWFNLFVVRLAIVHGSSMYPTLENRNFAFIWQFNYTPQNGDIIVLFSDTVFGVNVVKRVIATGGQYININGNYIYIYEGYVFLIGDNQNESRDSRHYGVISEESIMGRVFLVLTPFPKFLR